MNSQSPVSSIGVVVAARRGFEAARRWIVAEGFEGAARVRRTSSISAGVKRRRSTSSWAMIEASGKSSASTH